MAPKKRRAEEVKAVAKPYLTSSRVTRSSTRRATANSSADSVVPPPVESQKKKRKKASEKTNAAPEVAAPVKGKAKLVASANAASKTIVIEHCKQCNSFKTRAHQVKNGLENHVSGITVLLNPDKPRRGCFEIREEGGEKFISLLDMKRPFKKMKDLDMEKVISDIVDKVK
ncbi:uncharacterized protein LOC131150480 [Malania oleifera]|uniref:uncharacterized protein LOC131150480 n=1 Tax=Malania oleifera TaxID=397392 RepID=UPI0025ADD848|nr:uncharacterized protein LOC131150480 [Malania oleifera]